MEVVSNWKDDHTLEAEATVVFPFDESDVHYGLSFVLTCDGLTGSTGSWSQLNYYSNRTDLPASMDVFAHGERYVSGLVFNDVFVGWSGKDAIEGSLPASATGETAYSYHYTFDISTISPELVSDKSKLRVNALLIDTNTTLIANANKAWAGQSSASGIDQTVTTNGEAIASTRYFDMQGRQVQTPRRGLFIKADTLRNGTVHTRKVIF